MTYDTTNSGTLGRNKRKEKDTHPDHTGKLNVEGKEYFINAWVKENRETGEKFFSLSVKPKDQQSSPQQQAQDFQDTSGDVPF